MAVTEKSRQEALDILKALTKASERALEVYTLSVIDKASGKECTEATFRRAEEVHRVSLRLLMMAIAWLHKEGVDVTGPVLMTLDRIVSEDSVGVEAFEQMIKSVLHKMLAKLT